METKFEGHAMKAAVIDRLGEVPQCREVPEPAPAAGQEVVRVRAAAIKNIERMLAAGTHYGSSRMALPGLVGLDAVVELADGRRAYAGATPPGGAMGERMLVDPAKMVLVPGGVDDASAAALPNAGVSAWFSLESAGRLQEGQSVLILGATGVTGALAVQLAKHRFAAGHVVAVGRDHDRLTALTQLGADETISVAGGTDRLGAAIARTHGEHPFDVVLDYLWGDPAEQTLRALGGGDLAADYHQTRFVQLGETAGSEIRLPASVLRSAGVQLLGQGGGSVPTEAFARIATEILPELFDMLAHETLRIDTTARHLDDVARAWSEGVPSGTRTVLIP